MTQVHILANSECFDIKKITFFEFEDISIIIMLFTCLGLNFEL